jgi:hypothetical protein
MPGPRVMLQGMRECRWSQPQFCPLTTRVDEVADAPWECIRIRGEERPVDEAECAGCEHWEPDYTF